MGLFLLPDEPSRGSRPRPRSITGSKAGLPENREEPSLSLSLSKY